LRQEGFTALYRGLPSPLAGAMLENAMIFLTYEESKLVILKIFKNESGQLTVPQSFIVGACCGVGSTIILTPVELLKIRLQQGNRPTGPQYSSVWDCFKKTFAQERVKGIYRGVFSTLMRECIGNAVWFGSYDLICQYFTPKGKSKKDLSQWHFMFAGGIAGVCYWGIPFPIDTIKSRIQGNTEKRIPFLEAGKIIYKESKLRGFYKGTP
jgi:ornithine carrier protein